MIVTKISWDWKSNPDIEELQQALEPFGISVYENPQSEGSDSFGYIFSETELDEEELEEKSEVDRCLRLW